MLLVVVVVVVVVVYPQAPSIHFSRLLRHAWATVGELNITKVIEKSLSNVYPYFPSARLMLFFIIKTKGRSF
jgi:hypothetical protein